MMFYLAVSNGIVLLEAEFVLWLDKLALTSAWTSTDAFQQVMPQVPTLV